MTWSSLSVRVRRDDGARDLTEMAEMVTQTAQGRALTHEVATGEPLVVADARRDPVIAGNPAIEELGVVAYAGVPLITADGHALGSLCVADREPREWSTDDVRILGALATAAMKEIETRTLARATAALAAVL